MRVVGSATLCFYLVLVSCADNQDAKRSDTTDTVAHRGAFAEASDSRSPVYALRQHEADSSALTSPFPLRDTPHDQMTVQEATMMLRRKNLFDLERNPDASGLPHIYKVERIPAGTTTYVDNDRVIVDSATGLMWQWMGSHIGYYDYEGAIRYVTWLNEIRFAGFADWRLPTLEEAMSLVEASYAKVSYLERTVKPNVQIGLVFPANTERCWTSDRDGNQNAWRVDYVGLTCELLDLKPSNVHLVPTGCIRAVRSLSRALPSVARKRPD